MHQHLTRLARVTVGAALAALALASPAAARTPVDPNTLNPAAPGLLQRPVRAHRQPDHLHAAFRHRRRRLRRAERDHLRLDRAAVLAAAGGRRQALLRRRRQPARAPLHRDVHRRLHEPGHRQGRHVDPARHRDPSAGHAGRRRDRHDVRFGSGRPRSRAGRTDDPHRRGTHAHRRVDRRDRSRRTARTPSTTTTPAVTATRWTPSAPRWPSAQLDLRRRRLGRERWGASAPAVEPRELLERHPASLEAG